MVPLWLLKCRSACTLEIRTCGVRRRSALTGGRKMQPDTVATRESLAAPSEAFCQQLEEQTGQKNFHQWFHGKTSIQCLNDEVRIGVGSQFLLSWMQRNFGEAARAAAVAVCGRAAAVRFELDPGLAPPADVQPASPATAHGRPPVSASQFAPAGLQKPPATASFTEPAAGSSGLPATLSIGELNRAAQPVASPKPAASAKPAGNSPRTLSGSTRPESGRAAVTPVNATYRGNGGGAHRGTASRGRRFADLSDFVEGDGNRLALAASLQVSDSPGEQHSPLYLHGGIGVGKSHLLEGIYRRLKRQHPKQQILFLTSEQFTNQFTEAMGRHVLPALRQRFRTVDVLLIDDIEFFGGKRVVQEEFLHTFKTLAAHDRQLIFTADRHPRLLEGFSEELASRLGAGLVCRVAAPELETRREILRRKCEQIQLPVGEAVLNWIAGRFAGSVRELEGALNCLAAWHRMTGRRISANSARRILAELERDCVRVVRLAEIEATVCEFFRLTGEQLRSDGRQRALTQPRMIAMYLARKHTQAAYAEIGRHFGGRNHATVISAEKKVRQLHDADGPVQVGGDCWPAAEVISLLEQKLRAC